MSKHLFLASALASFLIPGVGAANTSTGLAPESLRTELVRDIVDTWQPYVAEHYGAQADGWAARMAQVLRSTDMANLELAASAASFEQMNAAVLGGTRAFGQAAGNPGPAALGDPGADLVFTPVAPCRIVDTRVAGGAIAADGSRAFDAYTATDFTAQGGSSGDCGIPQNASALTVKITAVAPSANGYFTAYAFGQPMPMASSLNYTQGMILSNDANIGLCRPGCASAFNVYSLSASDVVIDVTGYFAEPVATALDCTVAEQTGNLDLLSGLQIRTVSCPAGYSATGGGCGGPLGIGVSGSHPVITAGSPTGWRCELVGSLLTVFSYRASATCCRVPGR